MKYGANRLLRHNVQDHIIHRYYLNNFKLYINLFWGKAKVVVVIVVVVVVASSGTLVKAMKYGTNRLLRHNVQDHIIHRYYLKEF